MAAVDGIEEKDPAAPPISDTNLDDTGELDYEPSEPSANSIKEAVSDDEEEGEAGDSEHEEKGTTDGAIRTMQPSADNGGVKSSQGSHSLGEDANEFSGPEEGEVDELEEGEVKDESDSASHDGSESSSRERTNRVRQKNAEGHHTQQDQKRRIPITAPPSGVPIDGRSKITAPAGDSRPEDAGVCKFYLRGQCTWGSFCKFLHPTADQPQSTGDADKVRRQPEVSPAPIPLMAVKTDPPLQPPGSGSRGSPPSESAWERGLKQARERIKKATEKKEIDPDFERKRLTMPLGSAIALLDDNPSPLIADPHSEGFRAGPRPLMEFNQSSSRFADKPFAEAIPPLMSPSRAIEPATHKQYGRQQQAISGHRASRELMDDVYPQPQVITAASRQSGSYSRSYSADRPPGRSPPPLSLSRERQHFGRDDYVPEPLIPSASQEITGAHSLSTPYYHQRNLGAEHQQHDRRIGDRGNGDAQRRRLEPEPQGWEFRRSPPAYYRDRTVDYERPQEPVRRSYDVDRPYHDANNRLQPAQQHPMPREREGQIDGRNNQQYRPPNYHYYRTLQQQQQQKDRPRVAGQDRKAGPDYNKDRDRERERLHMKGGRNDYNYHYYNTRDQKSQQQQGGSRPLPYERPSYNRQEHRSQWRDPWRRSPSPTGRPGATNAAGKIKGSISPDGDRTPTNSPIRGGDIEKQQRHRSPSSSISSSRSSRSKSSLGSVGSHGRQGRNKQGGRRSLSGRADSAVRTRSVASSRNSDDIPHRADQRRSSGSPAAGGRGRHDRGRRPSRDRSQSRAGQIGASKRDSSDVASRAAAKALGDRPSRSRSPCADGHSPRYRQGSSGVASSGRSSACSRNSAAESKREHGHREHTPEMQSPKSAVQAPPTRPLSPPPPLPPAPFLATAAPSVGRKAVENVRKYESIQSQQRSPIKMTIMNKSKVRTNIYGAAQDQSGAGALLNSDDETEELEQPVVSRDEPHRSPSGSDGGSPAPKKQKVASESGSGSENRVLSRREELLRQLRAVETAIETKRKKEKK